MYPHLRVYPASRTAVHHQSYLNRDAQEKSDSVREGARMFNQEG